MSRRDQSKQSDLSLVWRQEGPRQPRNRQQEEPRFPTISRSSRQKLDQGPAPEQTNKATVSPAPLSKAAAPNPKTARLRGARLQKKPSQTTRQEPSFQKEEGARVQAVATGLDMVPDSSSR